MPDLIYAIDVSNYQESDTTTPEALSALFDRIEAAGGTRPQHVVVRAGLACEPARLKQIALAQMQSAAALGCTVSLYGWAYGTYGASQTVVDMMGHVNDSGVAAQCFWADMEGSGTEAPGRQWFIDFIAACQANGITFYGCYSGNWWLNQYMAGVTDFAGVWYWAATYDQNASLRVASFGGMIVVAHQYSDRAPDGQPLDLDVFCPEACGWGAAA